MDAAFAYLDSENNSKNPDRVDVIVTDLHYLRISDNVQAIIGTRQEGTRIYRSQGSDEDVGEWFDSITAAFSSERFVSPGLVSIYAQVSRAGVHKRLKEGRLTAFMFHVVAQKRNLFDYQKKLKRRPYVLIPVSECKAWGKELQTRTLRRRIAEKQ